MNSWKAEFRMGTRAMRKQRNSIRLTQCRRRVCSQPMTPVMPKRGSQAPREAHLEPESGVKLGRAGMSGGKKKHSRMWMYRWFRS